jgi:dihydroorotate dehydrogenase electron transfer subunit
MDAFVPASASHRLVPVIDNVAIARDTFRLRLGDAAMARAIKPGQFVMIRAVPDGTTDPLLGRPLALYEVVRDPSGTPTAFDVVYLVVGRGTAALSERRPGERIAVWGPLGNGFGPPPAGPVVLVAGGIGQTPFLALGRWWLGQAGYGNEPPGHRHLPGESSQHGQDTRATLANTSRLPQPGSFASAITMLYGVRTAALLAGVDDFRQAGIAVEIATDDGTAGYHGYVTDILARSLERGDRPARVIGCGPPAMLATLAKIVQRYDIACEVSLENHMACGFGACFSCVVPIRQADGSTDLRRVCVEGPVVSAEVVDWPRLVH